MIQMFIHILGQFAQKLSVCRLLQHVGEAVVTAEIISLSINIDRDGAATSQQIMSII